MFFSKTKTQPPDADILIKSESVESVTDLKYLGVTLDQNLNCKKHLKRMVTIIKYNLANFKHIRNCLSLNAANICMRAMILSHMSYCIACWVQAGETTIRPLESLYKQTIKMLDKKPLDFHHCRLLKKYNQLKCVHGLYNLKWFGPSTALICVVAQ